MHITIQARGARRPGVWSTADTVEDIDVAVNVARSWFAKGYVVRIVIERAPA